jgi:PAS domain S-box-containing protein
VSDLTGELPQPAFGAEQRRRLQYLGLARRTAIVLASFLAFDLVVALGFGWTAFLRPATVFTGWIAVVGALAALSRTLHTARGLDRLFLVTFTLHMAGAIAVHWAVGGGWWLGPIYLGIIVIVGVTVLDGVGATWLVSLATGGWALLVWSQATGLAVPPDGLGVPSLEGNLQVALAQVALGTIGIAALVILQRAQVRSVKRSEESWRLLVDTAPDLIVTLDARGVILTANDTVVRVLGYARDELLGRPLLEFVDDDAELVAERLAQVSAGEAGRFEHRIRRADGSLGWLEVSAAPAHDELRTVGMLLTARDVTDERSAAEEREKLQHELAQGQRMQAVGRLVSGVAHELNNPLTAIIAFTEQLRDEERDEERQEMLAMVHRQALRSRDIVRDLLAVVRKREGRPAQRCTWADVLGRLETVLRAEVERLGAKLSVVRDGADAPFVADPVGLEQVLTNLVVNAAQATGKGGAVTLRLVATSHFCQLMVEDDGPGIPADVLGRVFEPFYTTKPEGEGTGLGLSVSLGIVEQAGGAIRAENRRPSEGGGARFTVTMPRADTTVADATTADASSAPSAGAARLGEEIVPAFKVTTPESARLQEFDPQDATTVAATAPIVPPLPTPPRQVLIVDDEDVIRAALRRYFQRRSWVVVEAANGDLGLDILRRAELVPDVIVSDLRMPGAGGIELHAYLEAERPELLPRLIISTGDVASPDAARFLERARCTVLEKPFDLGKLGQTVDDILAATGPRVAA